ncbi:MAG: exopolysaccharide biosynthesis polyprenyl glycosylphosphotransferase [Paeniclostridium sordellii]|nr:exopolysaccharide biosynthesis polyprenyl glycosylphosphotransferase [Paeniclostridium sordellii]
MEKCKNNIILKDNIFYNIYKRTLDIGTSFIGLIIGIPFLIVFGALIKLEDKGPIFYKQERLGKNEKHFYVYKLRSMRVDAEKIGGAQWAQKNDPRITNVGAFIRKTRIDEIPQLLNILKGDMSIIGPRPERPELTYKFNREIPGFINRLIIKPGLTGWAQVNGGYDMTPEEKIIWDIEYINNRSFMLDMKIILKTIRVIFTGEGAR